MGIRAKLLWLVALAILAPLLGGLLSIQILGRYHYTRQKGRLFETTAQGIARDLDLTIHEQIQTLDVWIKAGELSELIPTDADAPVGRHAPAGEMDPSSAALEARWPTLTENDPEVRACLDHPLTSRLRQFRARFPLFGELFVTDEQGRLIAATNKTSDYWQADETWWRNAHGATGGKLWLEGVHYDESARIYSLDVALPIERAVGENRRLAGVLKAVLDISPLLGSVQAPSAELSEQCHVILDDGRILAGLYGLWVEPLAQSIDRQTAASWARQGSGWTIAPLVGPANEMIGYSRLDLSDPTFSPEAWRAFTPMFVAVHEDLSRVLAPLHRLLWLLVSLGVLVAFLFLVIGGWFAQIKFLKPIHILHQAACGMMLRTVASGPDKDRKNLESADAQARAMLAKVEKIHTGDELERLARGFSVMAERVLHYHEQLENELTIRSEQIEQDLKMAREFLDGFLPKDYPPVPTEPSPDPIALNFFHAYRPAISVGGDFFEIKKLDDHRAGVFIADVMGHGARSALVTAMLRTLLQECEATAGDPAVFLEQLNRHFHQALPSDKTFIFASAFYSVFDTRLSTATFASAGHPPPLLIERGNGRVAPIEGEGCEGPALGMVEDFVYSQGARSLAPGEVFLFYTDGVVEAQNEAGREYGLERLHAAVRRNPDKGAMALTYAILEDLYEFMNEKIAHDDICMVAVETKRRV